MPEYCWKSVYNKCVHHIKTTTHLTPPSYGNYMKSRKTELPDIKVRREKKFAKCDDCHRLDEKIRTSLGSVRKAWVAEKDKHIRWQYRERKKYAHHKAKARDEPEKYLSIAIDGMDTEKTRIFRLARDSKATDNLVKVDTHLTGVLVHGRDPAAYCYTWHDRFPTGSDVFNNILTDVLCRIGEKGPLPPVLYLQLDNCWRENKNKYVFGLLHSLIHWGVFKKIKLSFLPKGHTHDDVDQMFSAFSRLYGRRNIYSLHDLVSISKEAYSPTPEFIHMDKMAAWAILIDPLLPKFTGIARPRCFIFYKDDNGVARHKYRSQLQQ